MATLPSNRPFGLEELAKQGVSSHQAARYSRTGWLDRIGTGTYAFPNTILDMNACLQLLERQVKGFHIGGKTALSLQGIRHNVSSRQTIHLWGTERYALPDWFTSKFPSVYYHRTLFDLEILQDKLGNEAYARPPSATGIVPRISVRERALLEVLNEVGVTQDLEEAENLFESFTSLRMDVMDALLSACVSVKTVRLFFHISQKNRVIDTTPFLKNPAINFGASTRWIRKMKDGTILSLNPIAKGREIGYCCDIAWIKL